MAATDQSNGIRDGLHTHRLRVYYDDTDAGGVVYYANYLRMAERARTELIRALGLGHTDLRAREDAIIAVRRCEIDYLRPALLDDLLEVRSRITRLGGATMHMDQSIWRENDELARLSVRLACISSGGRPTRFPDYVRNTLAPLAGRGVAGGVFKQEQRD